MDLVLFTLEYPYGKGEVFIENEIVYLSKVFERIYVCPKREKGTIRRIPNNVVVTTNRLSSKTKVDCKIYLKNLLKLLEVYLWTLLFSSNRKNYIIYYRSFLHFLIDDISSYKSIKKLIDQHKLKDAVFYDYWFVNATITLSLLKKYGIIKYFVARAHRFDLYDEIQFEKVVSFREFKLKYVDQLFLISTHGLQYLKEKVDLAFHNRLCTSYLGVECRSTNVNRANYSERFVFVSVSALRKHKDVQRIPAILSELNKPIHWIHFGDGAEFQNVKNCAEDFRNDRFSFEMKGEVENLSILKFYDDFHIDAFISLSKSEGIPVSMMEAVQAKIPVIAIRTNGIPELINDKNGLILGEGYSNQHIVEALKKFISKPIASSGLDQRFHAQVTYPKFIDRLFEVRK